MKYIIETMQQGDWEAVSQIYYEGILTKNATFQNEVPTWIEWDDSHLKTCRFVAKNKKEIIGWVALSPVSKRPVFAGVAEDSIYIKSTYRGKGVATALMETLIKHSEGAGIWTLEAKIFPENVESIALHEKFGFVTVGVRKKIGQMASGWWRDIVVMERRSKIVGQ